MTSADNDSSNHSLVDEAMRTSVECFLQAERSLQMGRLINNHGVVGNNLFNQNLLMLPSPHLGCTFPPYYYDTASLMRDDNAALVQANPLNLPSVSYQSITRSTPVPDYYQSSIRGRYKEPSSSLNSSVVTDDRNCKRLSEQEAQDPNHQKAERSCGECWHHGHRLYGDHQDHQLLLQQQESSVVNSVARLARLEAEEKPINIFVPGPQLGRTKRETRQWLGKLNELKRFKERNGHVNIPTCNESLYKWLQRQRKYYRSGTLPDEKNLALTNLHQNWAQPCHYDRKWYTKLIALEKFHCHHGHLFVPQSHYKSLYDWLKFQRKNKEELSEERIIALKNIDPDWERSPRCLSSGDLFQNKIPPENRVEEELPRDVNRKVASPT